MKIYIKKDNKFKEIVTTEQLANKAGLSKQAIQKNKYLQPIIRIGKANFYIIDELQPFLLLQKYKRKYQQ